METTTDRRRSLARATLAWALIVGGWQAPARAQPQDTTLTAVEALRAEIAALRAEYAERLAALEAKLEQLSPAATGEAPEDAVAEEVPPAPLPTETEVAAATEPPPPPSAPAEAPAGAPSSNYFNPAISLIGNFLAVAGENEVENLPSFDLREAELGLKADIDPYAKAEVFIAFAEDEAAVEEGFVTFTALPAGLLARVGRLRAQFGKTNPLHLHVLPWADEPLPIVNLLGEEGWVGDGLSVAKLIPLPGETFSELTAQIFRGDAEGLFEAADRSDLAYDLRYRLFRDLTEATNVDLGASYGLGPTAGNPDGTTTLQGIDATLRWKPLQTARYRSFVLRAEAIRRDQDEEDLSSLGWFVSAEHQLARRWFVGGRYETAEHADDDTLRDRGAAALLTFWPSEFSQLRAELRRRRYEGRDDQGFRFDTTANELLLQLQFAMGAHGAHAF